MIGRTLAICLALALFAGCTRPDPSELGRDIVPAKTAEPQAKEGSVWVMRR